MFLKRKMNDSTNSYSDKILQIKEKISQADAVIIGAGAGLSTSAGFVYDGELQKPEDGEIKRIVPSGLIPYCPHCGKPMSMNLRSDQTFVEDRGWHQAAERYEKFIQEHKKQKIVFLELGVGYNTPVLRSLSTRRKLRKNMVKQQIQGYLFNKSTKYGERRCA